MKQLDELWVNNSKGHFGYSVQKKIYLSTGNSLDVDRLYRLRTDRYRYPWNQEKYYNKFLQSVGWKRGVKWLRSSELPMKLKESRVGELPYHGGTWGAQDGLIAETCEL